MEGGPEEEISGRFCVAVCVGSAEILRCSGIERLIADSVFTVLVPPFRMQIPLLAQRTRQKWGTRLLGPDGRSGRPYM